MTQTGTWTPYAGSQALVLAVVLFIIAGVFICLGTRLHRPVGTQRPARAVSILLLLIWVLAIATFLWAIGAVGIALVQQRGNLTAAPNPISPITDLSAIFTFAVIAYIARDHGLKTAMGSGIVGAMAAPMIFELPFDLIVMWRISYMPTPVIEYTLLYFLPLFLVEISTISLLTLSPITKLSRYTLFSLAAMFLGFAVWACFGFSDPSSPIPIALNAVSKILSFITAITFFLPPARSTTNDVDASAANS
jgi:hypothetical protein